MLHNDRHDITDIVLASARAGPSCSHLLTRFGRMLGSMLDLSHKERQIRVIGWSRLGAIKEKIE